MGTNTKRLDERKIERRNVRQLKVKKGFDSLVNTK